MFHMRTVLGGVLIATALVTGSALAAEATFKPKAAGQFLVRARALAVMPSDDDSIKTAGGTDTGLRTRVNNNGIPELDLSYFVTDNIAVEAIAGWTTHRVKTQTGIDAGSVTLLPPTITVQYHPFPKERFSPYIGAGLNYTFLFNETGGAVKPVKFSNSVGPALQAGMDIALDGNWSFNIDVKKIWISSDVTLANNALKATADINPWLVGVGFGYRF